MGRISVGEGGCGSIVESVGSRMRNGSFMLRWTTGRRTITEHGRSDASRMDCVIVDE